MVVLNKPVKIILGSGVAILSLWLALVGFTAFQVDSAIRSEPPPSILDAPKLPRRQVPFVEPNSPWRKLNLQELTVPDEAVKLAPSMNVTTEMITAETVKVFTRKVMPVEVKSQLILAFLHGAAFTSDVWEYLGTIRLFGAMGYQCLAFDLPEHGQSQGRIGAVEAKRFVSKVQFMTALFKNMTNVVLVAPSMSGHYAIPFVLTKPEVLAGLVVVAPAASNIVPQSKLKALQVPTLNIYGANDKNLGPSSNLDLRVIPNYQSAVLPDASHAAYIDKPALFHSYLYNFLKKLEKKP